MPKKGDARPAEHKEYSWSCVLQLNPRARKGCFEDDDGEKEDRAALSHRGGDQQKKKTKEEGAKHIRAANAETTARG